MLTPQQIVAIVEGHLGAKIPLLLLKDWKQNNCAKREHFIESGIDSSVNLLLLNYALE